jgi:TRAP-type C4-dicarboxylate transport system permease small subunit
VFKRIVSRIPELSLLLMTTAVVLILCAQVVFRYFIGTSLDWIEEVSRILLTWTTFVGAAVALKRNGHITVDYFVGWFPGAIRRCVELFTYALIVAFSAFLCFQGIVFALLSEQTTFPALQVPVSWQYFGLPIGCLLMVIYGTAHLLAAIKRRNPQRVLQPQRY